MPRSLARQCCRSFHTSAARSSSFPAAKLDLDRYFQDTEATKRHLNARKSSVSSEQFDQLANLSSDRKNLVKQLDDLRRDQKLLQTNSRQGKEQAVSLREQVKHASNALKEVEGLLADLSSQLPNWSHPAVPSGDYAQCSVVSSCGPDPFPSPSTSSSSTTTTTTSTSSRDHLDIATRLGWVDFASGQRISGPRWPVLLREGAMLEWSLSQYALHTAIQHGFDPFSPPDVVKTTLSDRCGFQPRDGQASQSYYVSSQDTRDVRPDLVLAGTAEVPLAGHFSQQVFPPEALPMQLVALGRAFRAEAGARGREHRGLYRVHQFSKAELFVVCEPEESDQWLDRLVKLQMQILSGLELPLRVLHMSSEELGASAYQKYDIEAWMPGRGSWGELASASNCTDYQSRRLGIQMTNKQGRKVFAHTLNATAAAIPRLIVALIENGVQQQQQDGKEWIQLPRVLSQYWLGVKDEEGVKSKDGAYVARWS